MTTANRVLVITCGAIARELHDLRRQAGWDNMELQAISADLHATPQFISQAVADKIDSARAEYERIFVAYGDCGTSGELDAVLEEYGVERLPGAHCYEFLAGDGVYDSLQDENPGTFYLTDFLARHFDRLVLASLGLDRHPELLSVYFANYSRLVYLAQTESAELTAMAQAAANRLGLRFERVFTGIGSMQPTLDQVMQEALCQS
jgi:hypothetical protein